MLSVVSIIDRSFTFHFGQEKRGKGVLEDMSDHIEEKPEPSEAKLRHLEMIQTMISRMETNCFILKGWAVTLIAGVFVLASRELNPFYFLIAYLPTILLWFLDSYYIQQARKFRVLYTKIGESKETDPTLSIHAPNSVQEDKTLYMQCLLSLTEVWFYFPIAILVAVVVLLSN